MKKITIIGAGIGGLTLAIALKKKGFEVEVYEQAPEFKKAGSGINLAMNAMQVFDRLGVYNDIVEAAYHTTKMNARTKDLDVLIQADFSKYENEFKVKQVAIDRTSLHNVLLKHADGLQIHLGKKIKNITESTDGIHLSFEDGTETNASVVIGADGIHSKVREAIFPESKLRDAKQVCWRGIANMEIPQEFVGELNELWGVGKRFGFVPISDHEVYWFAVLVKSNKISRDQDIKREFESFAPVVNTIISKTKKENLLFNELWDLKPIQNWYKGNVCLMGDAAHATTPNLGQGACQAIESAFVLSESLASKDNVHAAFKTYQEIRKKKANYVTNTSWRFGKVAQCDKAVMCNIRNMFIKATPQSLSEKQSRRLIELNY